MDCHELDDAGSPTRTMSAIEPIDPEDGSDRQELPEFELEYLFDDDEDPTTVTVFTGDEESEDILTSWITIEEQYTIPLDEVP